MSLARIWLAGTLSLTLFLLAALLLPPTLAGGPFLESDVQVIHELAPPPGSAGNAAYGWVAAHIGDLDGDGADEFLITAPFYSVTAPFQGKIYLHAGATGDIVHEMTGTTSSVLGYSATGAGDLNDDGTPDYAVSGIGGTGRVVALSGADHSILLDLSGPMGGGFGRDIAGGTDFNGDGVEDLLVGAETVSETIAMQGRVYLLSGVNGAELWRRDGTGANDLLGGGVGIVGDVDGDTIPDVVAAARGADGGNGEAYVLSGADGATLLTLRPTAPLSQSGTFGRFFADAAGDSNNDGTPDIFIGEYNAQGGTGRAYLFSGVDGTVLHTLEAENPGDGFGPGRAIGDVNGDDHDDMIVAAYTYSATTQVDAGKAYLISGRDGTILRGATGSAPYYYLGVDALAVGDQTGDGVQEYLVTGYGAPSYVISFAEPSALRLAGTDSRAAGSGGWLLLPGTLAMGALLWRRRTRG